MQKFIELTEKGFKCFVNVEHIVAVDQERPEKDPAWNDGRTRTRRVRISLITQAVFEVDEPYAEVHRLLRTS